jgi:2-polyprenyl-3-methyl-5-hydroxy-6-metoxy-1,4-benzoquinol methylase
MATERPFEKFDYENIEVTRDFAQNRIIATFRSRWWQIFFSRVNKDLSEIKGLKIAEVGCGTGTMSLVLALMGAEATLIDMDERALEAARKMFALYGLSARFVAANAAQAPAEELRNKFDYVSSGGLIEHFDEEDRLKVMAYHWALLKKGGAAMINVPNRLSPFYCAWKALSKFLGQWTIEKDLPFDRWGLLAAGRKTGFTDIRVAGINTIFTDTVMSALAFFAQLKKRIAPQFKHILDRSKDAGKVDITGFISENFKDLERSKAGRGRTTPKDYLSRGLILCGTK